MTFVCVVRVNNSQKRTHNTNIDLAMSGVTFAFDKMEVVSTQCVVSNCQYIKTSVACFRGKCYFIAIFMEYTCNQFFELARG